MSPEAETLLEKTAVEQVKDQLEIVVKRMRRDQGIHIQLSNGKSIELKNSLLDKFSFGRRFVKEEWGAILDILIRNRFPSALIKVCSTDDLPPLEEKQQCFRLGLSSNCLDHPPTSRNIFVMQHSVPEVKVYTVRESFQPTFGHTIKAEKIGEVVGVEWHKLVYTYHQELPIRGAYHKPFQDAVLFDMLLDLVIGDFEPHTRDIADAPGLQLQLLLALEQEQLKSEAALGVGSKKRKLTIHERLDGKRTKKE